MDNCRAHALWLRAALGKSVYVRTVLISLTDIIDPNGSKGLPDRLPQILPYRTQSAQNP
jgi:hypothetical protein